MKAKTTYSVVDVHGAWIPLPLSLIFLTLQPSSLSTSFVLHPMALGKSSFMFSFFREPPFGWGSHYTRKGGCYSVWRTVSQWNCVYGLCKDSTFFPVGQQCVQVSLLPHFLSSQPSPFPSPGLERLSKSYRTLPENCKKNNYRGITGGITVVKEEHEGQTEWTDGKEIQKGKKKN